MNKICPRCGKANRCTSDSNCWCMNKKRLSSEKLEQIEETYPGQCLCEQCFTDVSLGLPLTQNYKSFQNRQCEFYPCHKDIPEEEFSCLFCYCPLYHKDCGNTTTSMGTPKDCSACRVPHFKSNYNKIISKLY